MPRRAPRRPGERPPLDPLGTPLTGLLADAVVVLHGLFIVFAVAGGLLVARRPWLAWLHLPAVAWAALVELRGWICPLTPLENALRRASGAAGYQTGFVEHYLAPLIYPAALTRELQIALGVGVLTLNVAAYAWVLRRRRRAAGSARA